MCLCDATVGREEGRKERERRRGTRKCSRSPAYHLQVCNSSLLLSYTHLFRNKREGSANIVPSPPIQRFLRCSFPPSPPFVASLCFRIPNGECSLPVLSFEIRIGCCL